MISTGNKEGRWYGKRSVQFRLWDNVKDSPHPDIGVTRGFLVEGTSKVRPHGKI